MALEIVAYASASMPDDDVSSAGGAIDTNTRVVFTPLAAADDLEAVSDDGDDTTQDLEVVARAANGQVVTDTVTLNGTTPVALDGFGTSGNQVERVLEAALDGDAEGDVTLRRGSGGATVAVVPAGERGIVALFRKAFASASGTKTYYEIIHLRNNDSVKALLDGALVEQADPGGLIDFAVATALNTSPTLTNRLTAPESGFGSFGAGPVTLQAAVGSPDLPEGSSIAICVRLQLAEANAAGHTTWTARATGTNT